MDKNRIQGASAGMATAGTSRSVSSERAFINDNLHVFELF
jgi:hypothetical protein